MSQSQAAAGLQVVSRPRERRIRQAATWGWFVLAFGCGDRAEAGDWPQILGPDRNAVAAVDERLAKSWPATGPRVVWERPVGRGFAGVAVARRVVFLFDRPGDVESLTALDCLTGEPKWTQTYPTDFSPQYGSDDGPLCVPIVDGDRVVTFGAQGVLACRSVETGEALWTHQTHREFGAREGYFGAGSSPLVVDGKVIVNVGGREKGAGVVAFDFATGALVWQAVKDEASYSSPVVATIDGSPGVIALTRYKCVSLSPSTGEVIFEFPYGLRGPTVTAANPVVLGDHLFLSASYGIGAVYSQLGGANGIQRDWSNDDVMSSQYTTCIEHEGKLIGIDGRQDIPPAELRCFDPRTQKVLWSVPNFGYASLIKADGKMIIAKTDGEIVLAELSTDAWRPLAKARVFTSTMRALPALSGGRLYVRDTRTLKCLDLSPAQPPAQSP
jgi:outer membrane protein assembly factor BamB